MSAMPQMKSARGNSWVQNLPGMQERHLIFLNYSLRKPLLAAFLCAKKGGWYAWINFWAELRSRMPPPKARLEAYSEVLFEFRVLRYKWEMIMTL